MLPSYFEPVCGTSHTFNITGFWIRSFPLINLVSYVFVCFFLFLKCSGYHTEKKLSGVCSQRLPVSWAPCTRETFDLVVFYQFFLDWVWTPSITKELLLPKPEKCCISKLNPLVFACLPPNQSHGFLFWLCRLSKAGGDATRCAWRLGGRGYVPSIHPPTHTAAIVTQPTE